MNIPTLKDIHELYRFLYVMLPFLALVWFLSFSWLLIRAINLTYRLQAIERRFEDQPEPESESLYD